MAAFGYSTTAVRMRTHPPPLLQQRNRRTTLTKYYRQENAIDFELFSSRGFYAVALSVPIGIDFKGHC